MTLLRLVAARAHTPPTSTTRPRRSTRLVPLFLFLQSTAAAMTTTATSTSTSIIMRNRIVVVGSANQDLVSYTSSIPTLGETVLGQTFETSCGGKGANQAVAAASLALSPVSMVCQVGHDVFGQSLLQNLRRVGVHVQEPAVLVDTSTTVSTGVAAITVDTVSGDNMIIVTPGANHAITPLHVDTCLKALQDDIAVVVVQLEITPEAALQALKTGREIGALTILNPAPAPDTSSFSLDEFYKHADIVIPNESELRKICGMDDTTVTSCTEDTTTTTTEEEIAMARTLLEKGVGKAVVVTLGARGAMVVTKDEDNNKDGGGGGGGGGAGADAFTITTSMVDAPVDLPARQEPVQDTVGAGDAFCGALAAYLSVTGSSSCSSDNSFSMSLVDAAIRACGVASMSVRRKGASYPTADQLPDCLKLKIPAATTTTIISKPAITFVTGNKNKLEEVKQILSKGQGELPFEIVNQNIDLPELQGEPTDIAAAKCRQAAQQIMGPCLTEDTSLCFNALNGMPGPFIKWFLEKCGHDGLNSMLDGFSDKTAYAQTVVAFTAGPGQEVHVFDGRTSGTIVPARGSLDFGWDPIFEPTESNGKTYAEMTKDAKNAISHRGRSFAKLHAFLVKNGDAFKANIK